MAFPEVGYEERTAIVFNGNSYSLLTGVVCSGLFNVRAAALLGGGLYGHGHLVL